MPSNFSRSELIWLPVVVVALLLVYLPGLDNSLVFDDGYLTDPRFTDYRSVPEFRARMLSYGSFVALQSIVGEGWWKQRLANLAIHLATVIALWGMYREILRSIAAPGGNGLSASAPPVEYHRSAALGIAIGFFALNPVAVYSVAYLIQRSILMATFFVVLGLWSFARALGRKQPWLHLLSLASYALAVMSKEHAIMAPLAAVPLYILIARPAAKRIAALSAAGALLVGLAGFFLWRRYGQIIGKPFDEYSYVYLAQLKAIDAGVEKNAFGLSIINQAWLFFQYGLRWMLPSSEWLSINLRPPFPVAWMTFPQVLGVAGYLGVVAGGFYLLLRYRDWRALLGISLLFPALLFVTEFATVWVQDPFVLYRSYLWAIGIPGLVFFVVHGPAPRILLAIGIAGACLLTWQSLDRVFSMATPIAVWSDAIAKLTKDPRSVGRWFPYLNRGVAYVDRDEFEPALRDFEFSAALGDMGVGTFNQGAVLLTTGNAANAVAAFDRAEKQGYRLSNLPLQRGLALMALGRPEEAYRQFQITKTMGPPPQARELLLLQLGRSSLQLGKHDEALANLGALLARDPRNSEGRYLQAMTYVAKGDHARARELLDAWLAERPNGPALYSRAMANYGLKRKAEALSDIEAAMRLGLDNPTLRQWEARIRAMP
ncbi:MAG: tetratricopeptide repeat protein [Usitatibacter sp.]